MFSATFPKNVENLAKKILIKPVEIVVGSRGQVCSNVEQIIEVREATSKFLRLLELLGEWSDKGSILIFVDRQIEADELFKELFKVGYLCLVLHGGQDQTDRFLICFIIMVEILFKKFPSIKYKKNIKEYDN